MLRWFQKLSLRNKLVLTILICLVLPSLISMQVSTFLTRDVVRTQVTDNSRESVRIVNQVVAGQIKNLVYVMNFVQFDSDMQISIRELGRSDLTLSTGDLLAHKQKISLRLDTVMNSFGNMYATVLLPNGEYVASYTTFGFHPSYFTKRNWFEGLSGVSAYGVRWVGAEPNYLVNPARPYLLTAAKPLRSADVVYGYVIVSVEMDVIQRLFAQSKTNETMLLVNRNGQVLVDRDSSTIGTPFPYYDKLPQDGGVSFLKVTGEEYIMLAEQVTPEWRLVSMSPYKQAASQIESFRRTDFMIQLAFLVLFAVILLSVVGTLTRPIGRLVQTVVRIQNGRLGERSNISGPDEVGRLGYVFDRMLDRIEATLEENRREQELKRKAELAMLQAQINPHFLFNVLNSIRLKIMMKGDEENAELISSLSSLLRMTINRNNEFIPLHEELDIIQHYVKLVNSRHGGTVRLEVSAASDTLLCQVPRFILQPLTENAYQHGLKRKEGLIAITSRLTDEGARLLIAVEDNGAGMDPERLEQLRRHVFANERSPLTEKRTSALSGIGLRNVYERLQLVYSAEQVDFSIDSGENKGTVIRMIIPLREEETHYVQRDAGG
ncbi:sensor histidine kinase [Paenibacillus sp. YN15]|uniref:cache domain-containing sensor histidine kinase n=1 Tax=Paenibacillus sp. YN15 TaxID=1742774 RepID=UPI000DCCE82F|nr:sensor histidine kinase [Paenibacillus sp. YN15]RAU92254.1 hypothetical protein DQG13_27840 [Paenibacillus sp. YN15]